MRTEAWMIGTRLECCALSATATGGWGRAEPGDTGRRSSILVNQGVTLVGLNANGHLLLQILLLHILGH